MAAQSELPRPSLAHPAWLNPGLFTAAVFVAVLLAYSNSFGNAFHFDDFHAIVDNPAVRSLGNAGRFFRDATAFSVLPANRTWRPIVSLSLAVDYALSRGYRPFWFHVSTFCWFLLLIGLLMLLYRRVLDRSGAGEGSWWLALIAAAWFGLHPAMAETVNYIIQRGDLYATLGCVAALVGWSYLPRLRPFGLYLVPLALGLLSKPPAAVFPALLFFWVFFFEPLEEETSARRRMGRAALASLPSVSVVVALLWLSAAMTPKSFAPTQLNAADYRLTQPFVWMRYFGEFFVPAHLNVDTDLEAFHSLNASAVAGFAFVATLLFAIWFTARRPKLYPIAYGLLWFVLTQLPTSLYALSEVENDHRMFFSFAGLTVAVVWDVYLLLERMDLAPTSGKPRLYGLTTGIVAVVLALYACGTHARNAVWSTEETLWRDDVEKSPHNGRGLMIYGLTQMAKGAYPQALAEFDEALKYTPNYPTLEINFGVVNDAMGREDDAERHFNRAIELAPGDDEPYAYDGRWLLARGRLQEAVGRLRTAVSLNPARPLAHALLVEALAAEGDTEAMVQAARETLAIAPDDPSAQRALADPKGTAATEQIELSLAAYRRGDWPESLQRAQMALTLDPSSAAAMNNVGAAYGQMGEYAKAVEIEQKAVALDPHLEIARNNLNAYRAKLEQGPRPEQPATVNGWVQRSLELNRLGRYVESREAAGEALKLDPHSAEAWNNIAAAEEAMHHWDAAINAARQALAIRPDFQIARNNLNWSVEQKRLGVK